MTDTQYRQALALSRYGLIAEFIQLPAGIHHGIIKGPTNLHPQVGLACLGGRKPRRRTGPRNPDQTGGRQHV